MTVNLVKEHTMSILETFAVASPAASTTATVSPVAKILVAASVAVSAFMGIQWLTDALTTDAANTAMCISVANTGDIAQLQAACSGLNDATIKAADRINEIAPRF